MSVLERWSSVLACLPAVVALAGPFGLGALLLVRRRPSETAIARIVFAQSAFMVVSIALLAAAFVAVHAAGRDVISTRLGPVFSVHDYAWEFRVMVDELSLASLGMFALIYPAIARFSLPFFYREPGALRYYFVMTLLGCGLVLVYLAGNIDILYMGWELVGVASVLLIAFFRHNPRANASSLRALVYYRICDMAILGAAVWMHHYFPTPDFIWLVNDASIPAAPTVALLLVIGTLAKSAQLPTTSWLPRAMEGPTASSAIFYGALSVHLGPFLLLRTDSLWMPHAGVRWFAGGIGALTAAYCGFVGLTRRDAKTSLAYATAMQLGLIYVEIALGWHRIAMAHVILHAALRTWQFLRSSSLIMDFQENPVARDAILLGHHSTWEARIPRAWVARAYIASLREFGLEALLNRVFVSPFLALTTGALRAARMFEPSTDAKPARFVWTDSRPWAWFELLATLSLWISPQLRIPFAPTFLVYAACVVSRLISRGRYFAVCMFGLMLIPVALPLVPSAAPWVYALSVGAAVLAFPFDTWQQNLAEHGRWPARLAAMCGFAGLAWLHAYLPEHELHWLPYLLVLSAVVQAALALAERPGLKALRRMFASQAGLIASGIVLGDSGWHAARLMLVSSALGSLALCGALLLTLQERERLELRTPTIPRGRIWAELGQGLANILPQHNQIFLVAGWLTVGIPGGLAFFAEDILFHTLAEHSLVTIGGLIIAAGINAITFYRTYLAYFCGPTPQLGTRLSERMQAWQFGALLAITALLIVFGLVPFLLV